MTRLITSIAILLLVSMANSQFVPMQEFIGELCQQNAPCIEQYPEGGEEMMLQKVAIPRTNYTANLYIVPSEANFRVFRCPTKLVPLEATPRVCAGFRQKLPFMLCTSDMSDECLANAVTFPRCCRTDTNYN